MTNTEKSSKPARLLKPVLAISVMLNLAVAGVVLGAVFNEKERVGQRSGAPLGVMELGPLTDALSEEDRQALRASLVLRRDDFRKARRDLRKGFEDLQSVLQTQPFDRAAVEAVLAKQSRHIDDQAEIVRNIWLDQIESMSDEERLSFAAQIEERVRRGPPDRQRVSDDSNKRPKPQ